MSQSSSSNRHAQVIVEVGQKKAAIDEMIAPLVRELWIAGLSTVMSCQEEYRETAWIEFLFVEDLERFINIVAEYDAHAHSMYARIEGSACSHAAVKSWAYTLSPFEMNNDSEDEDRPANFSFTANFYIPHQDIPTVEERLAAYNRRVWAQDKQTETSAAEPEPTVTG